VRCFGGGGVGEGELRDSRDTEERGIADDGDEDEGWQVGGVGQRVKPSVSHLQGFRHLPIAVSSAAPIITYLQSGETRSPWSLPTTSTSMSSSSSARTWTNPICSISLSSARTSPPQRPPHYIALSAITLANRKVAHLGSVYPKPPLSSRCRER